MSKATLVVLALAALAACSNNNDSGPGRANDAGAANDAGSSDAGASDAGTPGSAEGLYFGHADGGDSAAFLVLDGGAYYEWHYTSTGVYGGAVGTGALDGGTFATTAASISEAPAQLSAAVTTASFDGTLTFASGAASPSFTFAAAPSSTFHVAASIAAIQGAWAAPVILDSQSYGLEGQTITIDAQGNLNADNPQGCDGLGTVTPDPSGLGYFDFTLTYQGGDCIFGTQTLTGVVVVDPTGPQLLTSLVTSDGSDGIVSSGLRADAGN